MQMGRNALLLDRDGVINVNHGYVHQAKDCEFIDGIFELCLSAQKKGYLIIIVTNQSGIARGYYSQAQFHAFSRWIENQFWQRGIKVQHTYHCPHHPKMEGALGFECCCRKPRPGMVTQAQRQFRLNLSKSLLVGDSLSDMRCAQIAGVGKAIHFKPTDQSQKTFTPPKLATPGKKPYYRATDLRSISALL